MSNIVRDMTERKRVEEALLQKDEELTDAQRVAEVGSWEWNPESGAVTWSEELYRIAARDPNLPALPFGEHSRLFTPESWERLRHIVDETLRTGASYELDLEMIRPDGTTRWVRARGEARATVGRGTHWWARLKTSPLASMRKRRCARAKNGFIWPLKLERCSPMSGMLPPMRFCTPRRPSRSLVSMKPRN